MEIDNEYLKLSCYFSDSLYELEDLYNNDKITLKQYFEEKNRIIGVFINYSNKEQLKVRDSLKNLWLIIITCELLFIHSKL